MNPQHPLDLFKSWKQEAVLQGEPEPDAMIVATVDADGMPHARIVYLRNLVEEGFVFYTNYGSNKARQLAANANVSLNFHWASLDRQVRVCGRVEKAPEELSDMYYAGRARESQLGAWASPQSQVIPDREWLMKEVSKFEEEYTGKQIPRPPFWGGYLVRPVSFEFWTGRTARLHERLYFSLGDNVWNKSILAP